MNSVTAKSFELALCQASIFTPDEEFSSARLARDFLPALIERFDADPTILPVQDLPFPREIPKVIIRSKSGMWRCEFASARVNLFWQKPEEEPNQITLPDFFQYAAKLLCDYVEDIGPRVGRLAGLIRRYAYHANPAMFLSRHYCKDRWYRTPLNRPENFELHAHKKFKLGGQFDVNSWAKNKTSKTSSAKESKPIVLFEQDINTLSEEVSNKSFTTEQITVFYKLIPSEFDTILDLYYPENSQ